MLLCRAQEEMAPYRLSASSGRRSTSIGDLELASPGSRSVTPAPLPAILQMHINYLCCS